MIEKTCTACQQVKPVEEFGKHSRRKDGLQAECKPCRNSYNRTYYTDNKPAQIVRVRDRAAAQRKLLKEYIWELKSKPCTDCGNTFHPFVMDFDHVRGKKVTDLNALVGSACSLKKVQEEIDKCELVCSNCHRMRTGIRAGWIVV